MTGDAGARRRAERLVRWYPRGWRERYGAEFTELLVDDIAERPRSAARTADVARGGIVARLTGAGLAGSGLPAPDGGLDLARSRHTAASLATLGAAGAVFLVVAAAQWSQLLIGWVWTARQAASASGGPALAVGRAATLGAGAGVAALLALAVLAALPVLGATAAGLAAPRFPGQRRRLAWPAGAGAAAVAGLVIGGRSVENSWTGTGGLHCPVPGGIAAFTWAVTLFVSAYWGHPGQLAAFPVAERDWMALSPLLLMLAVASAVVLVRQAGLPRRAARLMAGLGAAACVVMTVLLALCTAWLAAAGPLASGALAGGSGLFHAGWVNVISAAVLALALLTGFRAAQVARRGLAGS